MCIDRFKISRGLKKRKKFSLRKNYIVYIYYYYFILFIYFYMVGVIVGVDEKSLDMRVGLRMVTCFLAS